VTPTPFDGSKNESKGGGVFILSTERAGGIFAFLLFGIGGGGGGELVPSFIVGRGGAYFSHFKGGKKTVTPPPLPPGGGGRKNQIRRGKKNATPRLFSGPGGKGKPRRCWRRRKKDVRSFPPAGTTSFPIWRQHGFPAARKKKGRRSGPWAREPHEKEKKASSYV